MGYSTVTETSVTIITAKDVRNGVEVEWLNTLNRPGMVKVADSKGNRVFLTSNAVRQLADAVAAAAAE